MGLGALFLLALNSWPLYVTYVYLKDDRAVARVESCNSGRRGSSSCEVTWRTADGRQGNGSVSGFRDDREEIDVRVTPLGGVQEVGDYSGLLLFIGPAATLAAVGSLTAALRLSGRRSRRTAKGLLDAGHGTVWRIRHMRITGPDGRGVLRAGWSEQPPGYRPDDLPDRLPVQEDTPGFRTQTARRGREFMAITDAENAPLFAVQRRGGSKNAPDLCLLAADGSARAVLQQAPGRPPGGAVVDRLGRPTGSFVSESVNSVWTLTIRNRDGDKVGTLARLQYRDWVLHLDDGAPDDLRDLGLAVALNVAWFQLMQP
ncbi:hypothetical protein [Spirillospora sp. NPDC047279]|uniref:hypothetical protein n=1 Tax=Spirillospora sp. NPDC047279 TaxID=3155478 RepID=UPI0033DF31AC